MRLKPGLVPSSEQALGFIKEFHCLTGADTLTA